MNMNNGPAWNDHSPEESSPEEKAVIVRMSVLESFKSRRLLLDEVFALDNLLQESYYDLLPSISSKKSDGLYIEFARLISALEMQLAAEIYNAMEKKTFEGVVNREQITRWVEAIKISKDQIIPRLESEGLSMGVKMLRDIILHSEIRIANDSVVIESEEKQNIK